MKPLLLAAVGAASLALAGCQTTSQQSQMTWVRIDGQSSINNPKIQQQFQIDRLVCQGETNKAASNMQPVYWRGIAGAVQAQMVENQRTDTLKGVAEGCMAEKGYIQVTMEEAQARNAARSRPRS
jgi:hypothetical protein